MKINYKIRKLKIKSGDYNIGEEIKVTYGQKQRLRSNGIPEDAIKDICTTTYPITVVDIDDNDVLFEYRDKAGDLDRWWGPKVSFKRVDKIIKK